MKKKIILTILILIFLIINLYTSFLTFLDYIAEYKTIRIENQNEYSLYMESEKKTVHIGSISNLDTKMLYLQVMLEKEKDNEGEIFLNIDFKTKNPYFKEKV